MGNYALSSHSAKRRCDLDTMSRRDTFETTTKTTANGCLKKML